MSAADWTYLKAVTNAYFANGAFRQNLYVALNAVGQTGIDAAAAAEVCNSYWTLMSATYTLAAGLGAGTQAIGTDPNGLVRNYELGSAAYADIDQVRNIFTVLANSAYQITPNDHGKLIYTTSGTNTWTLPTYSDVRPGFFCYIRNRSGANLTISRNANTINGAASDLTVTTGTARQTLHRLDTASAFEVA